MTSSQEEFPLFSKGRICKTDSPLDGLSVFVSGYYAEDHLILILAKDRFDDAGKCLAPSIVLTKFCLEKF